MVPMRKRRRDENGGESERAPPVSGFSSEECSAEEIKRSFFSFGICDFEHL